MIFLENISKSFGDLPILKALSLQVMSSEILGIAGPSGSGKSTLLRIIQGLETPQSGTVSRQGTCCFMFQDFQLFPHMSVFQNLVYAPTRACKGQGAQETIFEKALGLLEDLGLSAKVKALPHELSGGQKQRVALARSLMVDPDILLCDEPTSGLDQASTQDVVTLLSGLHKKRLTLLVASHDLGFLEALCTRIITIKKGVIVREEQGAKTPLDVENFQVLDSENGHITTHGQRCHEGQSQEDMC